MSREVLGAPDDDLLHDAPTRAIRLRDSGFATEVGDPLPSSAVDAEASVSRPPRSPRARASRLAALVAAALVLGAAAGWAGTGTGAEARLSTPLDVAVWSAVVQIDDAGAYGAMWARIRVVNDGRLPATVSARAGAARAGRASRAATTSLLDPPTVTVPGGRSADASILIQLDCSSPLALDIDPVVATSPDGTSRPIPVQGATTELARVCAARAGVVRLDTVAPDDGRLRVGLTVPGGRSLRVVAVTAGGLDLTGRPLPAQVDGQVRSIWLDPPTSCPPSWQVAGAPRVLTVVTKDPYDQSPGSTLARVSLLVGDALATWLMSAGCPADA